MHVCTNAYAYSWNLEKYIEFFHLLEAFLLLNLGKYFALYGCFCVRISFILLLIKWSEIDSNVKPQTLVETFDQANYNSIPEYNVALITLLTNFLCQHAQLSVASAVWRDCKLLYEGPWQTRDWVLLQFCIWAQGHNWYWWHYNRACLSEGYTSRPLLVTSLIGGGHHCHHTRDKYNKQLITAFFFVFISWKCPAENAGDGISETLNLKIFWGSMPPDSPRFGGPSAC